MGDESIVSSVWNEHDVNGLSQDDRKLLCLTRGQSIELVLWLSKTCSIGIPNMPAQHLFSIFWSTHDHDPAGSWNMRYILMLTFSACSTNELLERLIASLHFWPCVYERTRKAREFNTILDVPLRAHARSPSPLTSSGSAQYYAFSIRRLRPARFLSTYASHRSSFVQKPCQCEHSHCNSYPNAETNRLGKHG